MMTVATRLRQLIACSLSSSFTLFPFESSGRIFYFHFKPFLVVFFGRHAVFLRGSGAGIACQHRWETTARERSRELMNGTGLSLKVNVGGRLGTISAIQIVDIPAGQLKTDVS